MKKFILRFLDRLRSVPPLPILKRAPDAVMSRPRLIHNPERIRIGKRCRIGEYSYFSPIVEYSGEKFEPYIVIGDDVYIGRFSCITSCQSVIIGNNVVLSEHVYISDNEHSKDRRDVPIMKQPLRSKGPVRIGDWCFVGYGAKILGGVELGEGCVIGAGAVVTKSFPAGSRIGGVPARLLKE
ncbi:acyltransferase [Brevundimonas sp. TWP2-3-4b2]|uniref:acyltransferase n=1 Tax=Brevundimonas sp. TWP2-3-4b2 TaxID=2804595 RepID=UPI003CE85E08